MAVSSTIVMPDVSLATGRVESRTAGAAIQGHTLTAPGTAKTGVIVDLWMYDPALAGSRWAWDEIGQTASEGAGAFGFSGLEAGTYKLFFHATGTTAGEFWEGEPTLALATEIVLDEGEVAGGLDMLLHAPAVVSGTVVDQDGVPVSMPSVVVYRRLPDGRWDNAGSTRGEEDGSWSVDGLSPGTVRVGLGAPGFFPEFWHGAATVETATDIALSAGSTVRNVDASLQTTTIANTSVPTVSGTMTVGETLTADPGTWEPSDVDVFYTWLVDGQVANFGDKQTYVLHDTDEGAVIRVRVSAYKEGWERGYAVSAEPPGTVQPATIGLTAPPTITGDPRIGGRLTAHVGSYTKDDLAFAYDWLRDGVKIVGATDSPAYTPVKPDVGHQLSVRVTAARFGHISRHDVSAPTGTVKPVGNLVRPSITGQPYAGSVLAANPGTWAPSDVELSYQWKVNGVEVYNANRPTFKVTSAYAGQAVSVLVRAASVQDIDSVVTAESLAVRIQRQTITVLTKPKLSGMGRVGERLKLSLGAYDVDKPKFRLAWLIDGKPLKGVSGTKPTVLEAWSGHKISARITVLGEGYTNLVVVSNAKKIS